MAASIGPPSPNADAQPSSGGSLRLGILGPLRVSRDGIEVDAGPRRQAFLLALLVARVGKPTSTSELVELIWGDGAPASALNVIHKYVGALRRLLEPELPARGSGSYLQRRGNGYLFVASPGMLDLVAFRDLVESGEAALAVERREAALDSYAEALGLWRGSAGHGLSHRQAAVPAFATLNSEFFDACTAAAELARSLGEPVRALRSLRRAASMAPLHEPVQAALISTLAAAGQQAEALSVFERVRARLVEELGIDPGPVLEASRQLVLDQIVSSARSASAAGIRAGADVGNEPAAAAGELIGRSEELGILRRTVEPALAAGTGLAVVEGEPGVGKTRLLEEITAEVGRRGAQVVWGNCVDGDGTPSMWPWVQVASALLDSLPSEARAKWRAGELGRLVETHDLSLDARGRPADDSRFRLFGTVRRRRGANLVAAAGSRRHRRPPQGRCPIAPALRPPGCPAPGRHSPHRRAPRSRTRARFRAHENARRGQPGIQASADPARPIRPSRSRRTHPPRNRPGSGPVAARSIHARTAGNPFFVRELSRLLVADGGVITTESAAATGVPSTVRDVVGDRMAGLDDVTRDLLQIAALVGQNVDLGLLARVAGLDIQTCLDHLELAVGLGLLEPAPDDPFSYRFAHDLVRESVSAAIPPRRPLACTSVSPMRWSRRIRTGPRCRKRRPPPLGRGTALRSCADRERAHPGGAPRDGQAHVRGRKAAVAGGGAGHGRRPGSRSGDPA